MSVKLIKQLIDDGIIDFGRLILKHYRAIGLNETEAMILIELSSQLQNGSTLINPAKMTEKLVLPIEELHSMLDRLITGGFIAIGFEKNASGKEIEVFRLDDTIAKIAKIYQKKAQDSEAAPKKYATDAEEIVDLVETHFQKQLKPLEIEIIGKWLTEEKYPLVLIKQALLDAVRVNKTSLSYVDTLLLKRQMKTVKPAEVTYDAAQPEALKTFFDSWNKK